MDINAKVDVGNNLTSLIEKLATQIGVTADKVFPWYVKQQVIEGFVFVGVTISLLILFGAVFFYSFKKADFENGNRYIVTTIGGAIFFLITLFVTAFCFGDAVAQIMNPEYAATHQLLQDIRGGK